MYIHCSFPLCALSMTFLITIGTLYTPPTLCVVETRFEVVDSLCMFVIWFL